MSRWLVLSLGLGIAVAAGWVVLALSIGGYFFGVVGLLVGVPAAAIFKMLITMGMARYEKSVFYRGSEEAEAG